MKQGYVIHHWNGLSYDDHWAGILLDEGVFLNSEDAEKRVKTLQENHLFRLNDQDNEDNWYTSPKETWEVKPINIHK